MDSRELTPGRLAVEHLSQAVRRWLRGVRQRVRTCPQVRFVRFGALQGRAPVSRVFGLDRGGAIDRFYIERFLASHAVDIRGTVLEVGDATYTRRFGGSMVKDAHVLHAVPGNPSATLIGDLATGLGIPEGAFDCFIATQTLNVIYDAARSVKTIERALKPGGVVLATLPGISQISRYDMDRWGDFWRFTSLAASRLFEEAFPQSCVHVEAHGNVLAATAFLYGLAVEDLRHDDLTVDDPDYELLIAVRAVKPPVGA